MRILTFKILFILGISLLTSCSSSNSQEVVFKKSALEMPNANMVSCTIKALQIASPKVEGSSENTRSFEIENISDVTPNKVDLLDLNSENPKIRGNNGTVDLVLLGKTMDGYKTYIEKETAINGTASIFSYDPIFHKVIWTKNYGTYAHIGVGYCT